MRVQGIRPHNFIDKATSVKYCPDCDIWYIDEDISQCDECDTELSVIKAYYTGFDYTS